MLSHTEKANHLKSQRFAFVSSLVSGGSTTFVANISRELVARGIPTIVVNPDQDNLSSKKFAEMGVPMVLIDRRSTIFEDRMHLILHSIMKFQPTVVIGCLGQISYEILRYIPNGITRVGLIQTDLPNYYAAIKLYSHCLDSVVGVSDKIAKSLAQIPELSTCTKHCLPYGVYVPTANTRVPNYNNPLRIIYFGRLVKPQKRAHLFPVILKQLMESGIPFEWTLVGEGEERAFLEGAMVTKSESQKVFFKGWLPNESIPALLKNQDIILLASDAEGLPLSLLEAMGWALVPVVTRIESGIVDVVDNTSGLLIPVDQTEGYAEAIIHLHSHRNKLASMSKRAYSRVNHNYSVATMTARWLAAFPSTTTPVVWPKEFDIKPPLASKGHLYFSPPMRFFRRLFLFLRNTIIPDSF
jgi:colanic acid/amylovoran biosynthesis glycosyltransferase